MSSLTADRLYGLLPAIYRLRDAEQGEPLRALLALFAAGIRGARGELEQLYDDQFIETCADWVVPYIGDLIGYRSLHGSSPRWPRRAPKSPTPSAIASARARR